MPPPTETDRILSEAAKTLAPDKSLERADVQARFLFGTIAAVGALLTGFGVFSNNGTFSREPSLLIVPLSFICVSLVLSLYVLTPRRTPLNVENLIKVGDYFRLLIRRRARATAAAGVSFGLALMSIPIVAILGQRVSSTAFTASVYRTGENNVLQASVKYDYLRPNTIVTIYASVAYKNGTAIPVFSQTSVTHTGGSISADVSLPVGESATKVVIASRAVTNSSVTRKDEISLPLARRGIP